MLTRFKKSKTQDWQKCIMWQTLKVPGAGHGGGWKLHFGNQNAAATRILKNTFTKPLAPVREEKKGWALQKSIQMERV